MTLCDLTAHVEYGLSACQAEQAVKFQAYLIFDLMVDVASFLLTWFATTALSGIVGNQTNDAMMLAARAIDRAWTGKDDRALPLQQELQRAIARAFIAAQSSIAQECREELLGPHPKKYRGQPDYSSSGHEAALRWLDARIIALDRALADDPTFALPELEAPALLAADGGDRLQQAKAETISRVLVDPATPDCFARKVRQPGEGLFERVCAAFAVELQKPEVRGAFEVQSLTQINAQLQAMQARQLTVNDFLAVRDNLTVRIEERLTSIEALLQELQLRSPPMPSPAPSMGGPSSAPSPSFDVTGNVGAAGNQGDMGNAAGSARDLYSAKKIEVTYNYFFIGTGSEIPSGATAQPPSPTDTNTANAGDALPFPVPPLGRVTDAAKFFWAPEVEKTLRRVFEYLNGGSSVVLIADREMGKSSLLWAISQRAERELLVRREPVYLNLQGLQSDDDFYEELCEKLGLPNVRGRQLTRQMEGQRWLLCVDEVERFSQNGFPRWVREQLRGWAEGDDAPLRLVLAARKPLQQIFPDCYEEGLVSPLAGICSEEKLKVWSEATIRAYIAGRFEDAIVRQIIAESRGRPKQIMQLCFEEDRRQQR